MFSEDLSTTLKFSKYLRRLTHVLSRMPSSNSERAVSVIDTLGFDDPSKDHDAEIIAELVHKLHKGCDYVHLFVIAVNGQNPRLDGSLVAMTKIFEGMFGEEFWNQVVILFTRMPNCPWTESPNPGETKEGKVKQMISWLKNTWRRWHRSSTGQERSPMSS